MRFTSHFYLWICWTGFFGICSPVFSQTEPLSSELEEDVSKKLDEKHSLHVAYRIPEFRNMPIPAAGMAQLLPQPFPIVLGYSQMLAPRHALTAELGWSTREAIRLYSSQGQPLEYVKAGIPELRFGYRWMLSQSRWLVPYLGVTTMFGTEFTSVPDIRWIRSSFQLQAIVGVRIYPIEGPIFIQIEVPYSILHSNRNRNFDPANIGMVHGFWPSYFPSQFWPIAGLGIRW